MIFMVILFIVVIMEICAQYFKTKKIITTDKYCILLKGKKLEKAGLGLANENSLKNFLHSSQILDCLNYYPIFLIAFI
jgi:hypothetical protein